jgi:hypothetical protein
MHGSSCPVTVRRAAVPFRGDAADLHRQTFGARENLIGK